MPDSKTDLMDDGAVEVVETSPQRRRPSSAEVSAAAQLPAGGRLTAMRAAGAKHRTDFLRVRSALGSVQISIPHIPVFDALWALWAKKRADGEGDPGVTKVEMVEATGLDPKKIQHILTTFRRTGIARSITQHVGWRGTRSRYYPTDEGIFAFSLAEVLGHGSAVQVGHTASAWRARNQSEPQDIFQFAALYRGGADPKSSTSELK